MGGKELMNGSLPVARHCMYLLNLLYFWCVSEERKMSEAFSSEGVFLLSLDGIARKERCREILRMCVNDHFRPREIQRFTRFRVWLNTKDLLTGTIGGQFPWKIEQVPILTHKTGIGSNAADATWNKSQRQHEILTPSHDHHNKNQKSVEHRFCWFFWVQRCLRCTNFLCTYKREMMVRCCFCFV